MTNLRKNDTTPDQMRKKVPYKPTEVIENAVAQEKVSF